MLSSVVDRIRISILMSIQIRFRIRIGIKTIPILMQGLPQVSHLLENQLCKVKCVIIFSIFPRKKFAVVCKIFHLCRSRIDTDPDWSDPDRQALEADLLIRIRQNYADITRFGSGSTTLVLSLNIRGDTCIYSVCL